MTRTARLLLAVLALGATQLGAQIKLDASLKDLEKTAQRDSNDAAAHYNVALAYWNAKRFDDAERAFRAAIALDPRFAAPYVGLGYLPFARRPQLRDEMLERRVPEEWQAPLDDAERWLRRAFVLDPFVDMRLAAVTRQRSSDFLVEIQQIFGEHIRDYFDALDHFYQGNDQKAFDRFQRVYHYVDGDRHPKRLFDQLLWLHGVSAARLKLWKAAAWDYDLLHERSLERERRDSLVFVPLRTNEFVYIRALLKQRLEEPNEAIRLFRQAIEGDVGLFMAHVHLAEIYEHAGMWDQSILSRRNAINANPDDPTLLADLGWSLAKARRLAEAEEPLRDAVRLSPRDPRSVYYLGLVQQQLGKNAEARSSFERFIALAPSRFQRQVADAQERLVALR